MVTTFLENLEMSGNFAVVPVPVMTNHWCLCLSNNWWTCNNLISSFFWPSRIITVDEIMTKSFIQLVAVPLEFFRMIYSESDNDYDVERLFRRCYPHKLLVMLDRCRTTNVDQHPCQVSAHMVPTFLENLEASGIFADVIELASCQGQKSCLENFF